MFKSALQQDSTLLSKKNRNINLTKVWKFIRSKFLIWANILLFLILILSLGILFLHILPVIQINRATLALAQSQYNEQDIKTWSQIIENSGLIKKSEIKGMGVNNFTDYIIGYQKNYEAFNKQTIIKLLPIAFENYTESQNNVKNPTITSDDQFPDKQFYLGDTGVYEYEKIAEFNLIIDKTLSPKLSQVISFNRIEHYTDKIFGTADNESLKKILNSNFEELLRSIKDKNEETAMSKLIPLEKDDYKKIITINEINSKLDSIKHSDLQLEIKDTDNIVYIGKLPLTQNNSNFKTDLDIYYLKNDQTYLFGNVFAALGVIPSVVIVTPNTQASAPPAPTTEVKLDCSDCWLAPVDKTNKLSSGYSPSVNNSGIAGGGQITNPTKTALNELNSDANLQGININVISAYRSYQTQVGTFEYWVQREIAAGLPRAQAEVKANLYSARPGHSEHQLGTTVDLKCQGCSDFDNSENNIKLYKYLESNCYKFGFAISYPQNSLQLTGYKYEPWHLRYIGKDLAQEFFNSGYLNGNGNYLAKFLEAKHLF